MSCTPEHSVCLTRGPRNDRFPFGFTLPTRGAFPEDPPPNPHTFVVAFHLRVFHVLLLSRDWHITDLTWFLPPFSQG